MYANSSPSPRPISHPNAYLRVKKILAIWESNELSTFFFSFFRRGVVVAVAYAIEFHIQRDRTVPSPSSTSFDELDSQVNFRPRYIPLHPSSI